MWMLLPALSLAVAQIAGDNAGVVPDAAAQAGTGIYIAVVLAYMVLGAGLTGVSAWIGVRTGTELAVVVRRLFGSGGKRCFAIITLGVSVPASALTGGYFAGWLVHTQTGLPQAAAAALCLAFFTLMAAGLLAGTVGDRQLLLPALSAGSNCPAGGGRRPRCAAPPAGAAGRLAARAGAVRLQCRRDAPGVGGGNGRLPYQTGRAGGGAGGCGQGGGRGVNPRSWPTSVYCRRHVRPDGAGGGGR